MFPVQQRVPSLCNVSSTAARSFSV
jgi:hypothetical protein